MLLYMAPLAAISGGLHNAPLWDGWSRLVPRLSWHDRFLLADLPPDKPTAIAKALAQARGDAQLVLGAHHAPCRRVVLEPEAWRNQVVPARRSVEFRRLGGSASLSQELKPATLRTASASALLEYALAFLHAEEARSADALLTPYHLAGGHGRAGREGELRLAQVAVEVIRRERMEARDSPAKPVLAGIAVRASDIGNVGAAVSLARSYATLDVDGFWVQFAGLSETEAVSIIACCSAFLFALQELSEQRVFAVDVKNLVWPLLAGGLHGACIGIGEREAWEGIEAISNARRNLKPSVLHFQLLRNFVAAGPHARRAFDAYPCECGAHDPARPPQSRPDIRRHTLRERLEMEAQATAAHGVQRVRGWLTAAEWAAAELALEQPRTAAYDAALAAGDWRAAANL